MAQIQKRYQAVESALAEYKADPGYDNTGYVEYSQVLEPQRRQLSGTVQAFAESLSNMSGQVSLSRARAGTDGPPGSTVHDGRSLGRGTACRRSPGLSAASGGRGGSAAAPSSVVGRRGPSRHRRGGHAVGPSTVPFYGTHQAGIVTPAQDRLAFATFNVVDGTDRTASAGPVGRLERRLRPR